jgi:hypothetical protein
VFHVSNPHRWSALLSKTRAALAAFDNQHDFERLAADVLNGLGYQKVEPMAPGGGPDGGRDIKFTEADAQGIAFVTLEQRITEKFRRDLRKQKHGEGTIALFCNVDVSPSMKLEFAREAAAHGYTIEVFDLERLRSLLDGRFKDIRLRYLHIDPSLSQIPDVILSHHPARAIARRLPPSAEIAGSSRFDPVGPRSTTMTHPLRSMGITPLRRFYEAVRPSPAHRYFQPRDCSHLNLFPWHHRAGSHVPYRSPVEVRAAYMPDATWAVSGIPQAYPEGRASPRF